MDCLFCSSVAAVVMARDARFPRLPLLACFARIGGIRGGCEASVCGTLVCELTGW